MVAAATGAAPGALTGGRAHLAPGRERPGAAQGTRPVRDGGGGGNRTRVLQYLTRASPGAACFAFLSPGDHASKTPTGSAAVRCPAQPRDRVRRWILLTDARHRVGGVPGLTACLALSGESEVSAHWVGTYCCAVTGFTRSQPQPSARFPWFDHRSRNRSPPMKLCGRCVGDMPLYTAVQYNARSPAAIPAGAPRGAGYGGGTPQGPCGRWQWPKRARRGRPAGSEPVQCPSLPRDETRTFEADWAATPKRNPVTGKDARG